MESSLYREMHEFEEAHWWFRAKHRIVLHLIDRFLPLSRRPRFLDVGCGTGGMLKHLESLGEAVGVDVSAEALAFASKQTKARLIQASAPDGLVGLEGGYDCVLMLDLLEHLEDDLGAIRAGASLLSPGGVLIITVPAYQWLYAPRDEYHHHLRRYSRHRLVELIREAGLKVRLASYFNFFLFAPAAVQRILSRIRREEPCPDLSVPPPPFNRALEEVFASERFLLPYLRLPWGLSLVAVCRHGSKPD
jgi:SAM-dependent methyltransferase